MTNSEERELTPEELAAMAELRELDKVKAGQRVEIDAARKALSEAESKLNHRLKALSAIEAQITAVRADLDRMGLHVTANGPEVL